MGNTASYANFYNFSPGTPTTSNFPSEFPACSLPPFHDGIKYDHILNVHNPQFYEKLNATEIVERFNQWLIQFEDFVHPPTAILAQFASNVYEDYRNDDSTDSYEQRLQLPKGWTLLTTAESNNGYFGAAFWNVNSLQLVISHRGTETSSWWTWIQDVIADVYGVIWNGYTSQISSAVTFVSKVLEAFETCLKHQKSVKPEDIQLFITGHSLGGWLAQVTTFSCKYLEYDYKNDVFTMRNDGKELYHAYGTVFDSPGCKSMLEKIADDFGERCVKNRLECLHIQTYLSAPNPINTCHKHAGEVYRIIFKHNQTGYKKYVCESHSRHNIVMALQQKCRIVKVVDWPVILSGWFKWSKPEYLKIFEKLNIDNKYDVSDVRIPSGIENAEKEYAEIRYQTLNLDTNVIPISILTYAELEFLRNFLHLVNPSRTVASAISELCSKCLISTDEVHKAILTVLQSISEISHHSIRGESKELSSVVPLVKRLNSSDSIVDGVRRSLSNQSIKETYSKESEQCKRSIEEQSIRFRMSFSMSHITNDNKSVCVLTVPEGLRPVGMNAIYQSFHPFHGAKGNFELLVLKASSLILFQRHKLGIKDFINCCTSNPTAQEVAFEPYWILLIDCDFCDKEDAAILNEVFQLLKHCKAILCVEESFSSAVLEVINRKGVHHEETGLRFRFSDLTDRSQNIILDTEFSFQDHITKLRDLVDISELETLDHLIDMEMVTLALNHKISIPFSNIDAGKIESVIGRPKKKVDIRNIVDAMLQNGGDIFIFVTGARDSSEFEKALKATCSSHDIEEKKILNRICSLEDGIEENFHEICHKNPNHTIHWIARYEDQWEWKEFYNQAFYCPRQLTYTKETVSKKWSEQEFCDEFKQKCVEWKNVSRVESKENDDEWKDVSSDEGKMETDGWRNMSSDSFNVKTDDWKGVCRKTIIISDEPGMGKSTSLEKLAMQLKSDFWVILINLKSTHNILEQLPDSPKNFESIFKFLSPSSMKRISMKFLKHSLQYNTNRPPLFLLDGYDELSPSDQKKLKSLLKFIKDKTKGFILITTRRHDQSQLETCLSKFSISFERFDTKDRKQILKEAWRPYFFLDDISTEAIKQEMFEAETGYFNVFADALFQKIDSDLKSSKSFICIPLQIKLLADGFLPMFRDYVSGNQNVIQNISKITVLDLYKSFIQRKCEMYIMEKERLSKERQISKILMNVIIDQLHKFAFSVLFPEQIMIQKDEIYFSWLYEVGFLIPSRDLNYPEFIHYTFAEYFVADLFLARLQQGNVLQWFKESDVADIFLIKKYATVRMFMNQNVASEIGRHRSDRSYDFKKFKFEPVINCTCEMKRLDAGNCLTPIHVLADENLVSLLEALCVSILDCDSSEMRLRKILNKSEKLYNRTPLICAAYSGSCEAVKYLLELTKKYSVSEKKMYKTIRFALIQAVKRGHSSICEEILNTYKPFVDVTDKQLRTPLHWAVKWELISVIQLILAGKKKYGLDINAKDKKKSTALHAAARAKNSEIIQMLCEEDEIEVNSADDRGWTPLIRAVECSHIENVRYLICNKDWFGLDLNAIADKTFTALHLAAKIGNLEICKCLVEQGGADLNFEVKGLTPLDWASRKEQVQIINYFREVNFTSQNPLGSSKV